MTLVVFYFILGIIFVRSLIANIHLILVLWWLKRASRNVTKNSDSNFVIIIPVLREQKVIEKTVEHFLSMDYPKEQVVFLLVTTERELADQHSGETTLDVIDRFAEKANKRFGMNIIRRVHYPKASGKMVDQINYSFSYALECFMDDRKNTFVSIYNADSRPSLNTLSVVSCLGKRDNGRVYQQSALFFDNFHEAQKAVGFLEGGFIQANGTLHSRWTLAHEMPRFFRQSFFLEKLKKRIFLSHCVGHGLFLRSDLVEEIGEMPTGTMTEDLFLGYVLSLLGEPIYPLPVMEMAEMPDTLYAAFRQKYVWFFGPFDHFKYANYFSNKYPKKTKTILTSWFVFQGIFPAFIWLIQGWLFLFIFLYPILTEHYYLLWFSLVTFIFYGPLSYWLVLRCYTPLARLCSKDDQISSIDIFRVLLFSFPTVVLHSLPPLTSLYSKLRFLVTGKEPSKPKTER